MATHSKVHGLGSADHDLTGYVVGELLFVAVGPVVASTGLTLTSVTDHLGDVPVSVHAAGKIAVTPTGNLSSTTVQAALVELQLDIDGLGTPAASAVAYGGSPNWFDGTAVTAVNVEAAIDEVVTDLAGTTGAAKIGTAVVAGSPDSLTAASVAGHISQLLVHHNNHLNDATAAHAASAISVAAIANLTATEVQAALAEHQGDINNLVAGMSLNTQPTTGGTAAFVAGYPRNLWRTTFTGGTIALPAATGADVGRSILVKKLAGGGSTTVTSGSNIDGSGSYSLGGIYDAAEFVWDGTTWHAV